MVATTKTQIIYGHFKLGDEYCYGPIPDRPGVTRYESEAAMLADNPAVAEAVSKRDTNTARAEIDAGSGVDIAKKHAAKYMEAILYLSGTVTDMQWLKHLADEHDRCGGTVAECAQVIFDKATEDADREKGRVSAKAAL